MQVYRENRYVRGGRTCQLSLVFACPIKVELGERPVETLFPGSSDSPACECIVRSIMFEDAEHISYPWFSRVPSKSNLADDPSRLIFPVRILNFKVEVCEVMQPDSLLNGVWPVLERGEK